MSPDAAPLTTGQRERFLLILLQGGSLLFACRKLEIPVLSLIQTMEADAAFREEVECAGEALSSNVAAALYRSAVEGNVTAQMYYLKSRPPRDRVTRGGDGRDELDELDELTDAELFEKCLAEGLPIPPEAEEIVRRAIGAPGA